MHDRTLFKIALGVILLPVLIVMGCKDRYRYPCQNPDNWGKAICQKPLCEVHRQCPELIFKENSKNVGISNDQISKSNTQQTCDRGCTDGK